MSGPEIAFVTGAAQGIGHAVARRLAEDGFRVVAMDRNAAALEAAVDAMREAGRRGAVVDVLDHRVSRDVGEYFSGETGGVEPRRDNGKDRRFSQRISKTLDRIGVHDESYHSGLCPPVPVASGLSRTSSGAG